MAHRLAQLFEPHNEHRVVLTKPPCTKTTPGCAPDNGAPSASLGKITVTSTMSVPRARTSNSARATPGSTTCPDAGAASLQPASTSNVSVGAHSILKKYEP